MNFNQKERTAIAEFIHAYQTDTLIKSEALDLIEVLEDHELISETDYLQDRVNEQSEGIADDLLDLITRNLPYGILESIMDEYYGKKPYNIT